MLASALVDEGRTSEAEGHLLYAMMLAEKLDSPSGKARAGLILSRLYEAEADPEAARHAYEMTLRVAEPIDYGSIAGQCRSALERLGPGAGG